MTTVTLDLLKDIFFIFFFLAGTLWMWGIVKLPAAQQRNMEKTFERSRKKFKWMFLAGFLLLGGLFLWQYLLHDLFS